MVPIIMFGKEKMEDLLYVKDYYLPVFASEKPENKTDAKWNLLHRQTDATPWKDFFTFYTFGDFGSVRMGNDGSAKAIGMGDVHLETSNGTVLILKNVKHIPNIRMNLISTGKLNDEGFNNTFCDSQWKLT